MLSDPDGEGAHRRAAGFGGRGIFDQAQLGEGAGGVAGVQEGAGGVGGGTGTAFGGRQAAGVQAAGVGEGGVDVTEVAVDPDPVQGALVSSQLARPTSGVREAGETQGRVLGLVREVVCRRGQMGLRGGVGGGEGRHPGRIQLGRPGPGTGCQVGERLLEQVQGLSGTTGAAQRGRGGAGRGGEHQCVARAAGRSAGLADVRTGGPGSALLDGQLGGQHPHSGGPGGAARARIDTALGTGQEQWKPPGEPVVGTGLEQRVGRRKFGIGRWAPRFIGCPCRLRPYDHHGPQHRTRAQHAPPLHPAPYDFSHPAERRGANSTVRLTTRVRQSAQRPQPCAPGTPKGRQAGPEAVLEQHSPVRASPPGAAPVAPHIPQTSSVENTREQRPAGNHRRSVASGPADLGLPPGGNSPTTATVFPRGEAVHFREHAIGLGVPAEAILLEPKAGNTGQNIMFSREVLAAVGIRPVGAACLQAPHGTEVVRDRPQAVADVEILCASKPLEFDDYLKSIGNEKLVLDMLVGDLQRVIEYPKLGFAIEQEIPEDVHAACESLINDGFTSRLIGS